MTTYQPPNTLPLFAPGVAVRFAEKIGILGPGDTMVEGVEHRIAQVRLEPEYGRDEGGRLVASYPRGWEYLLASEWAYQWVAEAELVEAGYKPPAADRFRALLNAANILRLLALDSPPGGDTQFLLRNTADELMRLLARMAAAAELVGAGYRPPAPDLRGLLGRAKAMGYLGVLVTQQRVGDPEFVAMLINSSGQPTGPRNHEPRPSPEAAIADLARQLTGGGT